jgi:hypothetical protein
MQRAHNHQVVKRQTTDSLSVPVVGSFSGGATASSGGNLGTSLLLGSTEASAPAATDPFVPGQATITFVSSSAPTQTDASSSSSSNHLTSAPISTGAMVGIIIGVFVVIIGAMLAIYTYFKRRTLSRARHTVTRAPPPAVRGAEGARGLGRERQWNQKGGRDHGEGKVKSSPGSSGRKRPDSTNLALFEKDLSVRSASDEKVTASENHDFDPSSMPNFAKYHPYLADDLPQSHPEGSTVVSWDGSVASGDPLLSLHASASDTMSPTAVIARQTPQATGSAQHRWESAEVLIMDETTADRPSVYSDVSQNPFSDSSAPRPSIGDNDSDSRAGRNPFFNASQHNPFSDRSARSRKSSVSTAKRSRTNSASSAGTVRAHASEGALLSLIAALNNPPAASEEQTTRTSVQTVTTSLYTPTESDFPMPAPKAF